MGMISSLEIRRKIIHNISLAIPIGYHYVSKETVLAILVPVFAFYLFFDVLRLVHPGFRRFFDRVITSRFLREREQRRLIGSTYFLIGVLLTIIVFPKEIAIASLYILIISDTAAALVGVVWGKTTLVPGKTLEGSLAFFVSGLVIVGFAMRGHELWGCLGVLGATLAELCPVTLDDNLVIPLVAGAIMWMGW